MSWFKNGLNTSDIVTKEKTDNWDDGIYDLYQGSGLYVATTGSANAYIATFATPYDSYVTGLTLRVKFNLENTGASIINVDALGVKAIKKVTGAGVETLEAGDIIEDGVYLLVYDGTDFIIAGQFKVKPMIQVFYASGTFTAPLTGTYRVTVVGGGGSTARRQSTLPATRLGGGGGGGASKKNVFLSKGDDVTVTVGLGGAIPPSDNNYDGNAGGTSSFGTHLSATGGGGGFLGLSLYGAGGIGGNGSQGDLNFSGGEGGFAVDIGGENRGINTGMTSIYRSYGKGSDALFGTTGQAGSDGIVIVEWMEG